MHGALILLVVLAAIAVTTLARRLDLQVPLVLVALGSAASFLPGLPRLELSPEVILGVVLPPLLYSAALRFSTQTLRRHLGHILRLGIVTVLVTAFAVAFFAHWLIPGLTLGAAVVLGAVVAPTDAVSAVSVGRRLGLPRRVLAVLTGEGLVNDASALTLFTVAVAGVVGARVFEPPVIFFGYEVLGGIAVGAAFALVVGAVRARMRDPSLETVLGLMLPFAAYLAAEEIEVSGVLAVVTAGVVMGHRSAGESVTTRLQERSVWSSLDQLLEMFVFAYMGLQFKWVIEDVRDSGLSVTRVFLYALAVLAVVMAVRPGWLMLHWFRRHIGLTAWPARGLRWRETLVVSWAGMRGVVTLAAAAGVPVTLADGTPFPGREIIQTVAFVVAVGTLLIQGATMPALIRVLRVDDPHEEQRYEEQFHVARDIAVAAGEEELDARARVRPDDVPAAAFDDAVDRARRSLRARRAAQDAEEAPDGSGVAAPGGTGVAALLAVLRRDILRAERAALVHARDCGILDDEVLRSVLESLDLDEAAAEERVRRRWW